MRNVSLFFVIAVFFLSCKKDKVDPETIRLGYEYFPNKVGTYITYQVTEIVYGSPNDTSNYTVKELLAEEYVDGTNQLAMKVERYKRPNDSSPWVLDEVWTQKRTSSVALRTEDNVTYVRLKFPIEVGSTWNGNAYNTLPAWNYEIKSIDAQALVGSAVLPNTLTIQQRNNVNLVEQQIASEIYAKDIGLAYKKLTDLQYQLGQISGISLEMTMIDHGEE